MKGLCIIATFVAVIGVSVAEWTAENKPSFCKNSDCPEFDVLEKNDDYEIRQYKSAKWVSHGDIASPVDMSSKMKQSFMALFRYIGGNNDRSMKISMTRPVATMIRCIDDDSCDYERSFYIPSAHQDDAPNPSDSSVNLKQWSQTVYVRSFGGRAKTQDYEEEVENLAAAINDPTKYDNTRYYRVGYDGPWTYINRHNEVWLLATQ